jgi:hypothetical protein
MAVAASLDASLRWQDGRIDVYRKTMGDGLLKWTFEE